MAVREALRPVVAGTLLLIAASAWFGVRDAQAQVDMTGDWYVDATVLGENGVLVSPRSFSCILAFVQTGMSLTVTGTCGELGALNLSGTVDPGTGEWATLGSAGGACTASTTDVSGTANTNNKTFSAGFQCPPIGSAMLAGTIAGSRCGNGDIDAIANETCDDGNNRNFDCCNSDCELDVTGASCLGDANQCTDDVCDGAGICTHPNRTGPCDDGDTCSTDDACVAGSCAGTPLPNGAACDDFDSCTDENCQAGQCIAIVKPDGSACDDGFDCTAGETCLAAECAPGAPVVCPRCMACNEGFGCEGDQGSYLCSASAADSILLKDTGRDVVKWKFTASGPLEVGDFGNPVVDTPYELCIFDAQASNPSTGGLEVLFSAAAPAGSGWKENASGFRFKGPDKFKVRLKAGDEGKAKIVVKAAGPAHDVLFLPPTSHPVLVQLRTPRDIAPARCFRAEYSIPTTSTEEKYKSQNPSP